MKVYELPIIPAKVRIQITVTDYKGKLIKGLSKNIMLFPEQDEEINIEKLEEIRKKIIELFK